MTNTYLTEHNVIELLKNQLTIQSIALQTKPNKGLRHIIQTQTKTLSTLAGMSGINVEQIEAELSVELKTMAQGDNEQYFAHVNKRTGLTRDEFNKLISE